jgi:serine phosphatase RsbU (regulator of sigma subunit)
MDFEQNNTDSSVFYANQAYHLAKESNSMYLLCKANLVMGMVFQNTAEYKKAASYYVQGTALAEKLGDNQLLSQAYNGFGNLFSMQKQFESAASYYYKALEISKKTGDTRKVSVILMNLANIEYSKAFYNNDYTKCNEAYAEAYKWAFLAKDTSQIISCLGNWGMSYGDEGKFALSIEKLQQAITLANKVHNTSDLVSLKYYLGRTYVSMKENGKARIEHEESLELAKKLKDADFIAENYYSLSNVYYALKDYKLAYDYFERYKNLEDTLSNKDIVAELNTIKTKYETEKKQKQIELLEVNANKDKVVKFSLLAGAVMLLFLAFLMFNRYRLKEKTNKLLEHQNIIISEKNKDISDSINYAKKIQEAILPSAAEIQKVFPEHFVLSLPKDVVSGDFYWFTQHEHLKLFVVADCTGHGVPGAFMSMIGNTLLNHIVIERKIVRPDLILNELRKEIIKSLKQGEHSQNKDGMDVSLVCLNTQTNELEMACANNPIWILKGDKTMVEIKPDKQPIGYVSGAGTEFSLQKYQAETGDIIFQFTDGFADQFGGPKGKKFKYIPFKELLVSLQDKSLSDQSLQLKDSFFDWKRDLEQIDDVLISGIRV